MPYIKSPKNCEQCGKEYLGSPRQSCCSKSCAATLLRSKGISEATRRKLSVALSGRPSHLRGTKLTEEHKRKVSDAIKRRSAEHPDLLARGEALSRAVGQSVKGKRLPNSLAEISSRTMCKVFKRLGVGCSRCGWNKAACDLHHIRGRKIPNANSHDNLTYICPNCHREAHSGLIEECELVTLTAYIGDRWKEFYYG